ncbi:MAG TPA: hypothetical protein VFV50_18285 [Bdellovibrionales bacterium]|nr:hypothetical protein [Bdellovibrionales bacterium]
MKTFTQSLMAAILTAAIPQTSFAQAGERYLKAARCAKEFREPGRRTAMSYEDIIEDNVVVRDVISDKGFYVYNESGAYFYRRPANLPNGRKVFMGLAAFPKKGRLHAFEFTPYSEPGKFHYYVTEVDRYGGVLPEKRDLNDKDTLENLYRFIEAQQKAAIAVIRSRPAERQKLEAQQAALVAKLNETWARANREVDGAAKVGLLAQVQYYREEIKRLDGALQKINEPLKTYRLDDCFAIGDQRISTASLTIARLRAEGTQNVASGSR